MASKTTTDSIDGAFRSARLVYRAVEATERDQKFILEEIMSDPVNVALSSPIMLSPPTMPATLWLTEKLSKAQLGVMICLPPPPAKKAEEGQEGGGGDKKETDGGAAAAAAVAAAEPTPIGYVVLGFLGPPEPPRAHHRHTELGITLARPYQNQGYGSEAINWALDWAFRRAAMHRVSIGTVSFNLRGQHLYKKLGFVEEGRSRESVWHDRKWYDSVSYGMLESEWETIRGIKKSE